MSKWQVRNIEILNCPSLIRTQYIAPRAANLTIQGYTQDAHSYHANTVNVTFNLSQNNVSSNDLTATVRAWAENLKIYNLNLINTFGHTPTKGQALALSAQATNQGYYGVQLIGYQDTLLANKGAQIYAKSLIQGAIDFIFGQTAQAWFEHIDISIIAAGYITASGRSANNSAWYVINRSSVRGVNASVDAQAGITYLGRPWRNYARVTFQETYLSEVVNPAGWSIWNVGDERTNMTQFEEYRNYGPGSVEEEGPRANFSTQLSRPRVPSEVLGPEWEGQWYVDGRYLS
ncbi:hypothetical protein H2203_004343 [Taxawa tesnikishii (nom. ined.)]|nr:hypothetical protein H2203_004343 [Dothideales sp. JES 119]